MLPLGMRFELGSMNKATDNASLVAVKRHPIVGLQSNPFWYCTGLLSIFMLWQRVCWFYLWRCWLPLPDACETISNAPFGGWTTICLQPTINIWPAFGRKFIKAAPCIVPTMSVHSWLCRLKERVKQVSAEAICSKSRGIPSQRDIIHAQEYVIASLRSSVALLRSKLEGSQSVTAVFSPGSATDTWGCIRTVVLHGFCSRPQGVSTIISSITTIGIQPRN